MEDLLGTVFDTEATRSLVSQNLVAAIALGIGLAVLYVSAQRIVHATVPRMLDTQAGDFEDDGVLETELEKRSETLESLGITILRLTALLGIVIIVIGIFELWSLLTVAALFLAAVTLAGQSIVLDYLMGLFIVVEGTFFKGDNIEFSTFRGDVEDVGLRRTIVRGTDGTVHSISNGELRVVSNRTRIFASAEIKVRGIREEDLDAIIEIGERVGREVADEPAFRADIIEPHRLKFMDDPDELGWVAVFRGRVVAARRWTVATEIRRRLNREFLDAGIELNKRGILPRLARHDATTPTRPTPDSVATTLDDGGD